MYKILRNNIKLVEVEPSYASAYTEALMGEHQVVLVFEKPTYVELLIGDYIAYEGIKYTINKLPTVKKVSARLYQYNVIFQHPRYDMLKVMYMLFDNTATPAQGDFTLTGTASDFAQLIIANMNRVSDGWFLGNVLETDYITLTFNNENCHTVMERLSQEFNTEYHVINKTFHLEKQATQRELAFEYGSTLYDIERLSVNSQDIVTRLYPFGSDKNISSQYRAGSSRLLLPNPDTYIESVNVDAYGVIEQAKTFDDIYPRLSLLGAGVVTGVGDKYTFADTAITFDVNDCLMTVPARVKFLTGECAGFDFEIKSYTDAAQTFIIIENSKDEDLVLPTDTIKPAIGDKYVLLDVIMPQEYQQAAETELLERSQEYLSANDTAKVSYRVRFSEIYAKQEKPIIQCSDEVYVYDEDLGIDEGIRIVKLQKGIRNSYSMQIELSNTVTQSALQVIEGDITIINNEITESNELNKRRGFESYKRTRELQAMVFDPDGYFDTDNIRPLSIEAGMISVGAKSQQYQLTCLLQPNYAANPQSMYWSAGTLAHFTLVEGQIKEWLIASGNITITGDNQTRSLYIYARCSIAGSTGDIYLSENALKFNSNENYWYFLIGILHSPMSGVRGISLSYGQTTINGQFIRTGVISSIDGDSYFNLNTGEIGGNIKFKSGDDYIDVGTGIGNALNDAMGYTDGKTSNLQAQIDGVIDSYFYAYSPTTDNYPANEWSTPELKERHKGDTFTNTEAYSNDEDTPDAGKSWRWVIIDGEYKWTPIADSDAVLALQRAAFAQDTADGKRRVFTETPKKDQAYDEGDLWVNATYTQTVAPFAVIYSNDLLRCKTYKLIGDNFNINHWELASKYTDDTAVNNLQIGGRNLLRSPQAWVSLGGFRYIEENNSILNDTINYYNNTESLDLKLEAGGIYTLSYKCIQLNGLFKSEIEARPDGGIYQPVVISSIELGRFETTFTCPALAAGNTHFTLRFYGVSNTESLLCEIQDIKLEKGNKATDWTEAPEDTEKRIAEISDRLEAALDDNIISVEEKKQLELDKSELLAEFNQIAYTAGILSLQGSDPYLDYVTAKNDLIVAIELILADMYEPYVFDAGMTLAGYRAIQLAYFTERAGIKSTIDYRINLNINTVGGRVDLIVNDNIIIPTEKITLKKDFDEITQDKNALIDQAYYSRVDDYYPDEIAAVNTTYTELSQMLGIVFYNMAINTDIAIDLDITVAEFQLFYSSYFAARSELIKATAIVTMEVLDDFAYAFTYIDDELFDMKLSKVNLTQHKNVDMYAEDRGLPEDDSVFTVLKGGYLEDTPDKAYLKNDSTYVLTIGTATKIAGYGAATQYSVLMYDFTTSTQFFDKRYAFSGYPRVIRFSTPATGKWSLLIYCGVSGATKYNKVEYRNIALQLANNEIAITETYKYLTDALANDTEISGGVVATNLLLMKNVENQIRAGVSGMEDNIGFWAGGNYQDALAGIANAIIYKNGLAKFKNADIEGNIKSKTGEIGGLKIAGNTLSSGTMEFGESAIELVSQLITPVSSAITRVGGWQSYETYDEIAHAQTDIITIAVSSNVKFNVTTASDTMSTHEWEIYIMHTNGSKVYSNNGYGSLYGNTFEAALPVGTYTVHAKLFAELDPEQLTSFQVGISGYETFNTITAIGYTNRTKIGNNGLFSFWGADDYLYYSQSRGLEHRGKLNIAGVLASGNVAANGVHANKWGAKVAARNQYVTLANTSEYTIPHSIGHINYTVQITINEASARFGYVTSKTANALTITIINANGTKTACAFEYMVIGSN